MMENITVTPAYGEITSFLDGFIANVLNPKAALFFISILPQFIDKRYPFIGQILFFGFLDIFVGLIWGVFFIIFINKVISFSENRNAKEKIEILTSYALLIIGTGLLVRALINVYRL